MGGYDIAGTISPWPQGGWYSWHYIALTSGWIWYSWQYMVLTSGWIWDSWHYMTLTSVWIWDSWHYRALTSGWIWNNLHYMTLTSEWIWDSWHDMTLTGWQAIDCALNAKMKQSTNPQWLHVVSDTRYPSLLLLLKVKNTLTALVLHSK